MLITGRYFLDVDALWSLVDSGGALAALVGFVGYLIYDKKRHADQASKELQAATKRNEQLVDRYITQATENATVLGDVNRAIERLADKLNV